MAGPFEYVLTRSVCRVRWKDKTCWCGRLTTLNRDLTATNRGICAIQGSDTPTTHRQRGSHGAKPRHSPWRQALSLVQCCLTGAGLPGGVPINAC